MITHEITLEEAPIAYKMLYNKEDGIIKTFIRP
jgi:threonine dehydrogenase-like Zn-dependent dehydrogenase